MSGINVWPLAWYQFKINRNLLCLDIDWSSPSRAAKTCRFVLKLFRQKDLAEMVKQEFLTFTVVCPKMRYKRHSPQQIHFVIEK